MGCGLVEQATVNRWVLGSSPSGGGVIRVRGRHTELALCFGLNFRLLQALRHRLPVAYLALVHKFRMDSRRTMRLPTALMNFPELFCQRGPSLRSEAGATPSPAIIPTATDL